MISVRRGLPKACEHKVSLVAFGSLLGSNIGQFDLDWAEHPMSILRYSRKLNAAATKHVSGKSVQTKSCVLKSRDCISKDKPRRRQAALPRLQLPARVRFQKRHDHRAEREFRLLRASCEVAQIAAGGID